MERKNQGQDCIKKQITVFGEPNDDDSKWGSVAKYDNTTISGGEDAQYDGLPGGGGVS